MKFCQFFQTVAGCYYFCCILGLLFINTTKEKTKNQNHEGAPRQHESKLLFPPIATGHDVYVLPLSELYKNSTSLNWYTNRRSTSAIWLRGTGMPTVTERGVGDDDVWVRMWSIPMWACISHLILGTWKMRDRTSETRRRDEWYTRAVDRRRRYQARTTEWACRRWTNAGDVCWRWCLGWISIWTWSTKEVSQRSLDQYTETW